MKEQGFALEPGGPERLRVSWEGGWANGRIELEGELLGSFANAKDAKKGVWCTLPDGGRVYLQLVSGTLGGELRAIKDGKPLPTSGLRPEDILREVTTAVFVVGGLNIILGLCAALFDVPALSNLGIGVDSILGGLLYGVVGLVVKVTRSWAAMTILLLMFVGDTILHFRFIAQSAKFSGAGLMLRAYLAILFARGLKASLALRTRVRAGGAQK